VAVDLGTLPARPKVDLYLLSANAPWTANTLQLPATIRPQESTTEIRDGKLILDLKPSAWCRVRIPRSGQGSNVDGNSNGNCKGTGMLARF